MREIEMAKKKRKLRKRQQRGKRGKLKWKPNAKMAQMANKKKGTINKWHMENGTSKKN
jgi:hypothetical protein